MYIVEFDDLESVWKRTETVAILRNRGETHNCRRAAMKIVFSDNNLRAIRQDTLDLVGPFPCCLYCGFDRFGTAGRRQRHVHLRKLARPRKKRPEAVRKVGA